jgi:hypothetical protein
MFVLSIQSSSIKRIVNDNYGCDIICSAATNCCTLSRELLIDATCVYCKLHLFLNIDD